jgi:hypothetical protein
VYNVRQAAGSLSTRQEARRAVIIEGTIVSKETGLSAVFEGVEQPYVRCVIARLDAPEVHAEARVVGLNDVPAPVGGRIKLEVTRTITDRRAGVVRFDCKLLEVSGPDGV